MNLAIFLKDILDVRTRYCYNAYNFSIGILFKLLDCNGDVHVLAEQDFPPRRF